MSPNTPKQLSVAVIGAGAAGLVATRELLREGHDVTVFEQNDNVGGIWDYQEECETEDLLGRNPNRRHVHSSMYSSLRTNLPRQIMSFSDFPFIPEVMGDRSHDSRRFPSHTEVQAWLEVFAAKFELRQHVRFNSPVAMLRPLPPSRSDPELAASIRTAPRWKLSVRRSAQQQAAPQHAKHGSHAHRPNGTSSNAQARHTAASLSDAGHAAPAAPAPASSSATVAAEQHSNGRNTNDPDAAAESHGPDMTHGSVRQNGARNQTADSANASSAQSNCPQRPAELLSERLSCTAPMSTAGTRPESVGTTEYEFDAVVVCVGNYHQPNLPDVRGMDDFRGLQMHAHNYRSSSMFTNMRVIIVGASFSGEELARAVAEVASHVYHSARSFQESTPQDRITRVSMLTELSSDGTASFQDGAQLPEIDAVIYCTGYQYAYPFLEGTGLITSHDMRVGPLWNHIFPPSVAPTLAFVGLAWKSLRNPQFELQSKLVARVLSGKVQLPSPLKMIQDVEDFYQLLIDSNVPVRYTHNQTDSMPINQWVYNAELARLCGPDVPLQPAWMQTAYAATSVHILGKPDTFRDDWGPDEIAVYELADNFCKQMIQDAACL